MARPRKAPDVGGGPPALTVSMVGNGTTDLNAGAEAAAAGRRFQEALAEQVRMLPAEGAVRMIARMARDNPDIVLRTAAFWDGMAFLERRGEESAVTRIVGEARRGRKYESPFYLVALVDQVIRAENCSVAKAAKVVFERHRQEFAKTAHAIENDYSRYKHTYDLWLAAKYVPGDRLTREPWRRR